MGSQVRRRSVIVVGASGSIGGAVHRALADAGFGIVASGRRIPSSDSPGERTFIACDVTSYASCRQLLRSATELEGAIDGVVDCTSVRGGDVAGLLGDVDPAAIAPAVAAATAGFMHLCHAALPYLRTRGGFIITLGADAGRVAGPGQSIVAAIQAARMMFVRSLATEVARHRIRVNCVSSSYVAGTHIYETARAGDRGRRVDNAARRAGLGLPAAAEIAAMVAYLAGDAASRLTGQVISINGGLSA